MIAKYKLALIAGSTVLVLAVAGLATPATADPSGRIMSPMAPEAVGPTSASKAITTSIILQIHNRKGLVNFIQASVTPGDPNYHHFLSVDQFRERFAPSNSQVQALARYLKSYGITVNSVYPDNLVVNVSGTAAQLNAAFATQLETYVKNGQRFHRAARKASLPGALGNLVLAVPGLYSEVGRYHPMNLRLAPAFIADNATPGKYPSAVWPSNGTATGIPGDYTVGDVANFYQINPLYRAGIQGQGQIIGILTFANFRKADVKAYWRDIGLKINHRHITKVMVDGGTPVAAGVGDDETSLDVEQSGGLAPRANIRVYIAPNTIQGGIDMFFAAVTENQADTISTSWGLPEEFYFAALNGGQDFTFIMQAYHEALMEAAAQGQSVFAAAGDSGAYDVNRDLPVPDFNPQLSVDYPASDPYITAAGGTTMKGLQQYGLRDGSTFDINIAQEQVWGWDYLIPLCNALGYDPVSCGIEFGGGGGGVSSYWPLPYYQQSVAGITQTQPGQSLTCNTAAGCADLGLSGTPPQTLYTLPTGFSGRNMPDLSLNADPETGYVLVDCTDFPEPANPGCAATFFGGTSFVAPQLNGITALVDQAAGSRVGLLNPVIYTLQSVFGYGKYTPFNDITAGDNWFYNGIPGYDNGAGIGTINATNLALTYVFLTSLGFGQH